MRIISVSEKSHKIIVDVMTKIQKATKEKVYVHQATEKICDFYLKYNKKVIEK